MKDLKKLEGLLESLNNLRKETNLYTDNLINQIEDAIREVKREAETRRLVPFDIEKAKQGAKVMTRDGHDVRILCYDSKGSTNQPIVTNIYREGDVLLTTHAEDGTYLYNGEKCGYDLMIAEECV